MYSLGFKLILGLLVSTVFVSAIQLIQIRQQNRLLFAQLQTLQQQHELLEEQWRKLQLEQSTWAQLSRIETIAKKQLNMKVPALKDTVIIRQP
jgi:cell division protein FtsL